MDAVERWRVQILCNGRLRVQGRFGLRLPRDVTREQLYVDVLRYLRRIRFFPRATSVDTFLRAHDLRVGHNQEAKTVTVAFRHPACRAFGTYRSRRLVPVVHPLPRSLLLSSAFLAGAALAQLLRWTTTTSQPASAATMPSHTSVGSVAPAAAPQPAPPSPAPEPLSDEPPAQAADLVEKQALMAQFEGKQLPEAPPVNAPPEAHAALTVLRRFQEDAQKVSLADLRAAVTNWTTFENLQTQQQALALQLGETLESKDRPCGDWPPPSSLDLWAERLKTCNERWVSERAGWQRLVNAFDAGVPETVKEDFELVRTTLQQLAQGAGLGDAQRVRAAVARLENAQQNFLLARVRVLVRLTLLPPIDTTKPFDFQSAATSVTLEARTYENFLAVIPSNVTNQGIFEGGPGREPLRTFFRQALHGESVVFAGYGYSGSGKTHALFGDGREQGLVELGLEELLRQSDVQVDLVSAFTLGGELRSDASNLVFTTDMHVFVNAEPSISKVWLKAQTKRSGKPGARAPETLAVTKAVTLASGEVGRFFASNVTKWRTSIERATPLNARSSRAHMLLTFRIRHQTDKDIVTGYVTVIDMAGVEDPLTIAAQLFSNPPATVVNRAVTPGNKPTDQDQLRELPAAVNEAIKAMEQKADFHALAVLYGWKLIKEGFFINETLNHLIAFLWCHCRQACDRDNVRHAQMSARTAGRPKRPDELGPVFTLLKFAQLTAKAAGYNPNESVVYSPWMPTEFKMWEMLAAIAQLGKAGTRAKFVVLALVNTRASLAPNAHKTLHFAERLTCEQGKE